jgi:hypothetical protein
MGGIPIGLILRNKPPSRRFVQWFGLTNSQWQTKRWTARGKVQGTDRRDKTIGLRPFNPYRFTFDVEHTLLSAYLVFKRIAFNHKGSTIMRFHHA